MPDVGLIGDKLVGMKWAMKRREYKKGRKRKGEVRKRKKTRKKRKGWGVHGDMCTFSNRFHTEGGRGHSPDSGLQIWMVSHVLFCQYFGSTLSHFSLIPFDGMLGLLYVCSNAILCVPLCTACWCWTPIAWRSIPGQRVSQSTGQKTLSSAPTSTQPLEDTLNPKNYPSHFTYPQLIWISR